MRAPAEKPITVPCSTCGAKRGQPCVVTMSSVTPPPPMTGFHRAREESPAR